MSTDERRFDDVINATISGPVSGQVAIGRGINQMHMIGVAHNEVTQADLTELHRVLDDVKAQAGVRCSTREKVCCLGADGGAGRGGHRQKT